MRYYYFHSVGEELRQVSETKFETKQSSSQSLEVWIGFYFSAKLYGLNYSNQLSSDLSLLIFGNSAYLTYAALLSIMKKNKMFINTRLVRVHICTEKLSR